MESNSVRRSLGIAGVLALGSIVIGCAQQQTAPPASGTSTPPPPPAATAPVAPVTGNYAMATNLNLRSEPPTTAQAPAPANHLRLWPYLTEMADWPEVDCGTAKLTTTASQPRCRRGPMVDRGRVLAEPLPGGCAGEWWSVSTRSPSNFGFALLNTIRTPVADCRSRYGDEGMAAAMQVALVARNGTGWSDVNQIGDIYTASFTSAGGETASFTSVGGENCKAFLKLGPPRWNGWSAWTGASGWLWVVRGWLCGVQGNSVEDRDLQSFVDALIVKGPTYD